MDYVQRAQQLLIAELERQHISTYAFFDDRGDLICKYEDTRRTENILNLSSITKKQHIDDLHVFDQEILKFFRQNFSMRDLSSNLRGFGRRRKSDCFRTPLRELERGRSSRLFDYRRVSIRCLAHLNSQL